MNCGWLPEYPPRSPGAPCRPGWRRRATNGPTVFIDGFELAGEAHDVDQRRAQVVADDIGEALDLVVGAGQRLRCARRTRSSRPALSAWSSARAATSCACTERPSRRPRRQSSTIRRLPADGDPGQQFGAFVDFLKTQCRNARLRPFEVSRPQLRARPLHQQATAIGQHDLHGRIAPAGLGHFDGLGQFGHLGVDDRRQPR